MRPSKHSLFFVATALLVTGLSWAQSNVTGGTVSRRTLPHAVNDKPITFGNTSASPGLKLLSNGSDAQSVFNTLDVGGNQIVIGNQSTADADYDHAAATDPTLFIHSDTDPTGDNTQWGSLNFDAAGDFFHINTDAPVITFDGTQASTTFMFTDKTQRASITSNTSTDSTELWLLASNYAAVVQRIDGSQDQYAVGIRPGAGLQWILTHYDNRQSDHGHNAMTDPVLYVHSSYDPAEPGAADTTQYVMLMHDQTDGHVGTGKGQIKLTTGSDAGVILPMEVAAVLNAPCAAANEGSIMYFEDVNDTATGGVCVCRDEDDGSTYSWLAMSASAPCP